jgi:hypothetical protein
MALDTFGMLPQLWLLYSADSESLPASWVSHFVGLMCIDRVARIIFWVGYFWNGPYLLSFIVPDVVHTLLMADYIYLWARLVKTASAAQLGVDELMALEGDMSKDDEKKKDCYIFWLKSQFFAMPRYIDQLISSPSEALSQVWAIMRQGEKQVKLQRMSSFAEAPAQTQFHGGNQYSGVNTYDYDSSPFNNQNNYSSSQSSTTMPAPMTSQSMPAPMTYGNAGSASPVRSPVLTAKYAASAAAAPPSSPPMMPLSHSVPSPPMTPVNEAFGGNYGYVPKAKTNVD